MAHKKVQRHIHRQAARFVGPFGLAAIALAASIAPAGATQQARGNAVTNAWSVKQKGTHLQIGYGSGRNRPQYADLDESDGYLRMINSTTAGWGTSVILLPALWSHASCPTDYCQGAPVRARSRTSGANLVLSIHGAIATLKVAVTLTFTPPAHRTLVAKVSTRVTGTVSLDANRPGEAFKPVMLASMHDSSTVWDARDAFTGTHVYRFPSSGWIIQPAVTTADFGLQGGTSNWKKNAPTIEVILNHRQLVTGWLIADTNPKHNNVGFWCAASKVLASWSFMLRAEAGGQL